MLWHVATLHMCDNNVFWQQQQQRAANCRCTSGRRGNPTASICACLHEQHTVATFCVRLIGSCDNAGAGYFALCLCDVHCETWEVMSEADSETLHWRAEIVQLYDGCLRFFCTNEGRPFVNTSAGTRGGVR